MHMKNNMKNIFSFLSYHNAVPLAAIVLTMGAGITFAATATGILPLSIPVASLPSADISVPESMDASPLLATNLDAFDFRPTVTGVVETDTLYTVSYSLETLAPEGSEWKLSSKTGEFSVAKDALGDGGLNVYVVGKLHDIENGERSYLSRAQTAEKTLADARAARPANAFSSLVGLALDQIPVPVVEKPAPESAPQPQVTPPVQEDSATSTIASPTPEPSPTPEAIAETTPTSTEATITEETATSTEPIVEEPTTETIPADTTATTTESTPEPASTE